MKVMVVDDVLYIRKLISDKLYKWGCEVVEAEDGEDAILKSKKEKPDIVLMDVIMPKMDGITATKIMKNNIDGKIIMCSSISDKKRILEALKAGASDYITKPIDDLRLKESVMGKDLKL